MRYKKGPGRQAMDDRFDLLIQQRESIEAELAKRTLAHKRRVDRIKHGARLRAQAKKGKASAQRPLDFLALGDSWFEYPLDGNTLSLNTAIVPQLVQIGSPSPLVLNYALHGQATTAVLSYENQERIVGAVLDDSQWVNGKPDAILVSMGGDDIVGDQFAIYLDYLGSGLDTARFQAALDFVAASYKICSRCGTGLRPTCRSSATATTTRSRRRRDLLRGPWLQPSLEYRGYNLAQGLGIVAKMIDGFAAMVQGLAADKSNKFFLVDTRNTLQRVSGAPWAGRTNSIPIRPGYGAGGEVSLRSARVFPEGRDLTGDAVREYERRAQRRASPRGVLVAISNRRELRGGDLSRSAVFFPEMRF